MSRASRVISLTVLILGHLGCGSESDSDGGAGGVAPIGTGGAGTGGDTGSSTGGTGVGGTGVGGTGTGGAGTGGDGVGGQGTGGAGTGGTGVGGAGTGGAETGGTGTGGDAGTGGDGTGGEGTGGTNELCGTGPFPAPSLPGSATPVWSGTGSGLFEGPVWIDAQGALYFSDMSWTADPPPSAIHKLTPPSTVDTGFVPNTGCNGLAVNSAGLIVAACHDNQEIATYDPVSAARTMLIDNYQGNSFNSPNDLTIRSDGTIYFTDPDWQLGGRTSETGMTGAYYVVPGGAAQLVDGTLDNPNGIALSPDETVLYLGDYNNGGSNGRVGAYPVNPDGSTGARSEFASGLSGPDGMGVDCAGNLYVAENGAGVVRVYAPDGSQLGSISVAAETTNIAFGGSDRQTLYVTAGKNLYSAQMNLPGYPY